MAMGFVLIGSLAMAAATIQHCRTLRRIRRDDFVYIDETSITTFTAIALTIIGVAAFALLVGGST